MNYGCGSTVHARDLEIARVPYVGVGGGMEYYSSPTFLDIKVVSNCVDVVQNARSILEKTLKLLRKKTHGLKVSL
jgi:hypothetical protein